MPRAWNREGTSRERCSLGASQTRRSCEGLRSCDRPRDERNAPLHFARDCRVSSGMRDKKRINEALARLCAAAGPDSDFRGPGLRQQEDPFEHLEGALVDLDCGSLAEKVSGFKGSWLHALSCMAQEQPFEGQLIVPSLLPPAPALTAPGGRNETLTRGVTACVLPPDNHLLILSPAGAEAAVYATSRDGLQKLGDSVAHFVESEVARLTGVPAPDPAALPAFGIDFGREVNNYAVIVAGRYFPAPQSQQKVHELRKMVAEVATRSGLPLAYVHMGTNINWVDGDESTYEPADAIIGLVTAWIDGDGGRTEPIELPREALDPAALARVPEELWARLEAEFGAAARDDEEDDDDDEGDDAGASREPGLFLAPAGWTVASLYSAAEARWNPEGWVDGEPIVTACAEDIHPGLRLDGLEELVDVKGKLLLYATYA